MRRKKFKPEIRFFWFRSVHSETCRENQIGQCRKESQTEGQTFAVALVPERARYRQQHQQPSRRHGRSEEGFQSGTQVLPRRGPVRRQHLRAGE